MKIAYLGIKGLPSKGGAERVVEAIAVRAANAGHPITVYCSKNYTPPETKIDKIQLIRIPTLKGKYLHMLSMNILSALHALVYGDYDLIHLHNVESSFILPVIRLRYPVLTTSHGPAYLREKWGTISRILIKAMEIPFSYFSNLCTSVSFTWADYYLQTYGKRVQFIPNGVDCQEFKTSGFINKQNGYISFAAGRILPSKGCHILLNALRIANIDVPTIIIGDFEQMPNYSQLLKKSAPEKVKFIPFISDKKELFQILGKSKFFIFPSTTEAMSMMLLEMAALGIPIIASDIPENLETIPRDCAVFFKSGNDKDLAEKLIWALTNEEKMNKIATRAQSWVTEHRNWDTIVQHYLEYYQRVIKRHNFHENNKN